MRAYVDPDRCTGCELCTTICPEVFEMDDNGTCAIVTIDEVPENEEGLCQETVDSCPAEAITVEE